MKWWRDANRHLREGAPVEVAIDVENVAAFESGSLPQMVGAVEDLPSGVRAAADLGEAGALRIGACAESRVCYRLGCRGLLAVERSNPVFFGHPFGMIIPAVASVHRPEVACDPEVVFPAGIGLAKFVRIGRYRSILAELPEIRHLRRLGRATSHQ